MDSGLVFLVISLGVILLLFSLLRRRAGPKKYPEIVQYLLWDIKLNQALIANFQTRPKVRYFEENGWLLNKYKIGFLSETVKDMLKEVFTLVAEYNAVIRASKKNKDANYRSLDLNHFQELLTKCRKELEDWMVKTTGSVEYQPKAPGISSFFLGDN